MQLITLFSPRIRLSYIFLLDSNSHHIRGIKKHLQQYTLLYKPCSPLLSFFHIRINLNTDFSLQRNIVAICHLAI